MSPTTPRTEGRRRTPESLLPPEERTLLAAERAARWGKVVIGAASSIGLTMIFIVSTGATLRDFPRQQRALQARQDTLAVQQRQLRAAFAAHLDEENQEDRAQTCALKRMAEQRDPSACFEFLPNPTYYDPPGVRAQP